MIKKPCNVCLEFPCFPARTLVLTEKGLVEIENVKVGDKVLTHLGKWKRVLSVTTGQVNTVMIDDKHTQLECIPNAPLNLEHDSIVIKDVSGMSWGSIGSVEYLPLAKSLKYENEYVRRLPEFSNKLFYFIGKWFARGWVWEGKQKIDGIEKTTTSIIIRVPEQDKSDLISSVRRITSKYKYEDISIYSKVTVHYKALSDFLISNFGSFDASKNMLGWVFALNVEYRQSLLDGILSCGCRIGIHTWKINAIHKKKAMCIRLLAESLGKETRMFLNRPPETFNCDDDFTPYYSVEVISKRHSAYSISSVIPTKRKVEVFGLVVEDENSYIADGVAIINDVNIGEVNA